MRFNIPENIQAVLACLRAAGFRAVPVGGCVRDLLLGHVPHDWDIATSATPAEMLLIFERFRTLEIGRNGAKHGTITIIVDHTPVEVTTFRQDGTYSDGRRPDSVCFSRDLECDLARRDFTINAMCLGENGGIIDLFGGQQDLQKGIIRAIGIPDRRFDEDALRILRALRFAAVLGFEIEPQTAGSMLRHVGRLAGLSAERVRAELEKLLCAPDCRRVLLAHREIIFTILPELRSLSRLTPCADHCCDDAYVHTVYAVEAAPPQALLRMALLLHDIGKPLCSDNCEYFDSYLAQSAPLIETILRRLKFGNVARTRILFLVRRQNLPLCDADRVGMKKLISKYGFAALHDLLALQRADALAQPDISRNRLAHMEEAERLMQRIAVQRPPLNRFQLAVSGRDLIAAGIAPGPQMGALLELLLQKVLEEELPNEATALLGYALHTKS